MLYVVDGEAARDALYTRLLTIVPKSSGERSDGSSSSGGLGEASSSSSALGTWRSLSFSSEKVISF